MKRYHSADHYLSCTRQAPGTPPPGRDHPAPTADEAAIRIFRPHAAQRAAHWFGRQFPGRTLYALKANDHPLIVNALYDAGIRAFDVASLAEIRQAAALPGARLYFMAPVKSRQVIATAYHDYGVRDFALDSHDELDKLLAATNHAQDLRLYVRLAVSNAMSAVPLDGKFGVHPIAAPDLLRRSRRHAARLGLCFHAGSQSTSPASFIQAIKTAHDVVQTAGVRIDILDSGGGFPAWYQDQRPAGLDDFITAIRTAISGSVFAPPATRLICEPGRALVAESESLLVEVMARKGQYLYINDGIYGALFEGAKLYSSIAYPTRLLRPGAPSLAPLKPFAFYGPSCDSADELPGPFYLPEDVREGDLIEIYHTGAYGHVSASRFNGFGRYHEIMALDEPLMSMYSTGQITSPTASTG